MNTVPLKAIVTTEKGKTKQAIKCLNKYKSLV